jgi:hypothetical protein
MLTLNESDILSILTTVKDDHVDAWSQAHSTGPARYDYIILAGRALQAANVERRGSELAIGCNWRRAVPGDLSMDGITVMGPDGRYYFRDVIVGAGGPHPSLEYTHPFHAGALLTDAAGNYAPQGYADPRTLRTTTDNVAPFRLGGILFWLVDGVLNPDLRHRCDRRMAWYRDTLGAQYVRFLWKKGQRGAGSDFWTGLVQDEQSLSTDNIGRVMEYLRAQRMKAAHCFFGDTLVSETAYMPMADQERLRDRILSVIRDYQDVEENVQIHNEGYPDGGGHGGESGELRAHARVTRQVLGPDTLIGLTSPQCHMDASLTIPQMSKMYGGRESFQGRTYLGGLTNFVSVHLDRSTNDPEGLELGPDVPAVVESGEPIGPGTSVAQETDPNVLADYIRRTRRAGWYGHVWTSGPGIHPKYPDTMDIDAANHVALEAAIRDASGTTGGTSIDPLQPVSDADLLAIADEFRQRGQVDDPAGIVEAGAQFGERIQAGRSRDVALQATEDWITFYYGPQP